MSADVQQEEDLWGYAKRLEFVRSAIAKANPGVDVSSLHLLDVGCGNASQLAIPLARLGYDVTGIDLHEDSIAEAIKNSSDLDNVRFICGAVGELERNDFDVIILSEVLEHVDDPKLLLETSLTRMRPDGLVIVTVPNGYGEFEWDSWLFRGLRLQAVVDKLARQETKQSVSSTENHEDGHVQFFTLRTLRTIFQKLGLEVIEQSASTVASGPIAGHTLARIPGYIKFNSRAADLLPMSFSSAWFFALCRKERPA